MSDAATNLALAEANAEAARARLSSTLTSLQARLDPKSLARDVKAQSRAVAKAGVNATIRNPGPVAGATALIGLFLARHRIAGLFHRNRPDPR